MAQALPDGLTQANVAEARGLRRHAGLLPVLLLGALMLAAMSGLLAGGRTRPLVVHAPAATLTIVMPQAMRNGVFFETRVRIDAHTAIAEPTLAIPPALWRDMTVNTQLPDAREQAFRDGTFRFTYDAVAAGDALQLKFDGQINPALTGGTAGDVLLLDGDRILARLPVAIRILP